MGIGGMIICGLEGTGDGGKRVLELGETSDCFDGSDEWWALSTEQIGNGMRGDCPVRSSCAGSRVTRNVSFG